MKPSSARNRTVSSRSSTTRPTWTKLVTPELWLSIEADRLARGRGLRSRDHIAARGGRSRRAAASTGSTSDRFNGIDACGADAASPLGRAHRTTAHGRRGHRRAPRRPEGRSNRRSQRRTPRGAAAGPSVQTTAATHDTGHPPDSPDDRSPRCRFEAHAALRLSGRGWARDPRQRRRQAVAHRGGSAVREATSATDAHWLAPRTSHGGRRPRLLQRGREGAT